MRWRRVAACVVLAACYDPNPPLGIPCNDKGECPAGQQCDPVDNVCKLPTEARALHDDTAADFAAGEYLDEVTVETQGFLGPVGVFPGGVRVSGIAANVLPNSFDAIAGEPRTRTAIVNGLPIDYGTAAPLGLDLGTGSDVTIVVELEVELDVAGAWGFELTANDLGFLEIAAPGSSVFQPLVTDDNSKTTTVFEAPAAGWYRLRGAFAKLGDATSFALRYDPPNVGGNFKDIPRERLRARVGDVAGLNLDGFENTFDLGNRGAIVFADSLAAQTFEPDPFGLLIGGGSYSLRFGGQFLIDVEGDYAFRIASAFGHRALIDGVTVADASDLAPATTVTPPLHLAAGWHDLVLDMEKAGDAADKGAIAFTIDSGPALVGASFAPDHLRPVMGRVGRWAGAESTASSAIPDGGAVSRALAVELPSTFTPTRVDAAFQIVHTAQPTVEVVMDPPAGANVTLASAGSLTGSGSAYRHRVLPADTAGTSWLEIASDNTVDAVTGTLDYAAVTVTYDGGLDPFPTSYRYVSSVHDLGEVVAFGALTWGVRQGTPDAAVVRLRTCETAAECASEPFTDVVFGTQPAVTPRRFAQYEIQVTTDGAVPTAIDFVDLAYSASVDN